MTLNRTRSHLAQALRGPRGSMTCGLTCLRAPGPQGLELGGGLAGKRQRHTGLHSVTSPAVLLARHWGRPSVLTSGHGLLEINFYFGILLDFQESCKDAQESLSLWPTPLRLEPLGPVTISYSCS